MRLWRSGSLSRSQFWARGLLLWVSFVPLIEWQAQLTGPAAAAITGGLLLVVSLMLARQRLHDRGRSGLWLLILLVPLLGPLWLFVELGLRSSHSPSRHP